MKHMTEAVDAVRKVEHRRLFANGDDTLKRTKYLWLFSEDCHDGDDGWTRRGCISS